MALTETARAEALRPKLLLFLSVDVVGSTAFKNQKSAGVQPWLPFFADFYKQMPVIVGKECRVRIRNAQAAMPTLWKSLGDELLFVVELRSHADACSYVLGFQSALGIYEESSRAKKRPLSLKATGWIAGFPVGNAEVHTIHNAVKVVDYIGPLVDTGFRLCKFSSARKFVVSVDLALLLSFRNDTDFAFMFDGLERLKGVLDDKSYPIIWIDMFNGKTPEPLDLLEDKLLNVRKEACSAASINKYCERYIEGAGRPLMRPFIERDTVFDQKPSFYAEEVEKIELVLRDLSEEASVESEDTSNKGVDRSSHPEETVRPTDLLKQFKGVISAGKAAARKPRRKRKKNG